MYAPTTDADTEGVEVYCHNLQQLLQEISNQDFLIIMGNWNAKIEKGEEQGIFFTQHGKYIQKLDIENISQEYKETTVK